LFYHGTNIEVQLGDKILWKRLFRKAVAATVVYIPGMGPRHPDMVYEGSEDWAFQLEDRRIVQTIYCPERVQPKPDIVFLARGEPKSLPPTLRFP
jgi:hypothetical protein